MNLAEKIRNIPDFPIKGVLFRDVTTLLKDGPAFRELIDAIAKELEGKGIELVVGPEARGFVVCAPLAYALGVGFAPARKPGKLPCETLKYAYGLEYGADELEIHRDAIKPGQRVAVVDDLLATGGTALATIKLIEELGGEVVAASFAIELSDLGGRETLKGYDVSSIIKY